MKEDTVRTIDETFYKFNSDQLGFYRTDYPPARLIKLGEERARLSPEDRVGLIADAAALAVSGDGTTAGLLALVEQFKDESNKAVWSQIVSAVGHIRSVFAENESAASGLKKFTLRAVEAATEKLGFEFQPNESFLTGQLRALLINTAGAAGHQKTITEAKRRFESYVKGDKSAIHPSLRLAIFQIVIRENGESAYKIIQDEYISTTSIDGKETCLQAMGKVQTASLARKFLDFQFSDKVAIQDMHTGSISLAANSKVRAELWAYIKENWNVVHKKLSGNSVVIDRYLKSSLSKFASSDIEKDIAAFFKDKDTKGYDRGLVQVSDNIKANARYKARDEAIVIEWLKAKNYT